MCFCSKLEDVYDKDCVLKADSSRERCYLTPAKSLWRTLVVGSSASSTTMVSLSKEHVHQLSKWQTEYG